jgi:hypothetical protein
VNLIGKVATRLPPDAAGTILRLIAGRWYERPRKRHDYNSWYPIIGKLVRRLAACPEQTAMFRRDHPYLLVAAQVRRSDLPRYNRRRQALAWVRGSGRRYRLVQEAFRALGYPDLEDACAKADGFTITRDPDPGEIRRIAILESVAKALLPDLLDQIELPPCKVIENPCAAWQGMTTCIRADVTNARWRGLRIRYRLPYVALKATLLHHDGFGDAVSTYLHELGHMFGGDNSAAFSHRRLAASLGQENGFRWPRSRPRPPRQGWTGDVTRHRRAAAWGNVLQVCFAQRTPVRSVRRWPKNRKPGPISGSGLAWSKAARQPATSWPVRPFADAR